MKQLLICILFFVYSISRTDGQSLAVNSTGAVAHNSAILDVSSTSKGVLIPRMTKAQKNAIATPAAGLLVYQSGPDSIGFHYYNGSLWLWLNPSAGTGTNWALTGNTGTDTAVNFIGTTDNMPLRFKQNSLQLGQWNGNNGTYFLGKWAGRSNTSGSHNIGIGDSALYSNTTPVGNVAIGYRALRKNIAASHNTAMGYQALYSTTAGDNTAIGYNTLNANTTGSGNTAMGSQVLISNVSGYGNTVVGESAMLSNTSGYSNSAFGSSALSANLSGTHNLAMGANSLLLNETGSRNIALSTASLYNNQSGDANIGIGFFSLLNNVSGNHNIAIGDSAAYSSGNLSHLVAIGSKALFANTSGTNITAIGDSALYGNTTGYKNVAIGNSALVKNTSGYQNTAIGYNALENNLSGFANIAIGDSALSANTTNWNIAIGRYALYETTTGDKNIAIGDVSLANNLIGANNVSIGYASQSQTTTNNRNNTSLGYRAATSMQGYSNTIIGGDAMGKPATSYTVNNTVAVGDSTLFNIATGASNNTAVGTKALFSNTSGRTNTAIGAKALFNNTTGTNNVAIGDSAAYNNTGAGHLVAIGSKALFSNTGGSLLTAIGDSAMYKNTTGFQNTAIGYGSMLENTSGFDNTAVGAQALADVVTAQGNTAFGTYALRSNTASYNTGLGTYALFKNIGGGSNTGVGYSALFNLVSGIENTALGHGALGSSLGSQNTGIGTFVMENKTGTNNTLLGYRAGAKFSTPVTSFSNNVFIGSQAGAESTGSNNVFIGNDVGTGFALSNVLAIDNTNTATPLIFGNFLTQLLRVNGTLNINNQYSLPLFDGAANQVLYTNGAGVVNWGTAMFSASNGLTATSGNVKLGGTLTDSTTIVQGNRSLVFDLNGTGDFYVRKNTTGDAFMVKDNGFVGLNTNDPLYRLHIVNTSGGNGPFGRGIVIENTNTGSNGEASISFRNNGPGSVASNSAWMSGLNNAANYVIAYGDSLLSANVKMKLDTLGNVSIGTLGSAAQSKLDVNGSFGNAIRVTTTSQTLDGDDHTIIIGSGAGAITLTLPAANTCDRREYIIVNRSAGMQTISSYNDFSGTSASIPANSSISLQSNGSNWFRIQ